MATVVITQNRDIATAIQDAFQHLDVSRLLNNHLVAVKPNDTYATEENSTGVTQPDTLRAVLREIKKHSPKQIIVSGGAGAAETEDVFRIAGLMPVVEEEGVEFFDHNREPFEEVELDYAPRKDVKGPQKSVFVNPRVFEYETLVAVNQLKMHATATVTLGLKNIAMSYPAADYYGHPRQTEQYHKHDIFDDMHSFIAAMYRRFPIQLSITVGHPAMIGTGPLDGYTFETGLVIASTDALAADIVAAKILGFNLSGVHHLWEAARMGLGTSKMDEMQFPALSLEEAIGLFTQAAYGQRLKF